jgi:hypothetical protein
MLLISRLGKHYCAESLPAVSAELAASLAAGAVGAWLLLCEAQGEDRVAPEHQDHSSCCTDKIGSESDR